LLIPDILLFYTFFLVFDSFLLFICLSAYLEIYSHIFMPNAFPHLILLVTFQGTPWSSGLVVIN
jgi:hypothetical protein